MQYPVGLGKDETVVRWVETESFDQFVEDSYDNCGPSRENQPGTAGTLLFFQLDGRRIIQLQGLRTISVRVIASSVVRT